MWTRTLSTTTSASGSAIDRLSHSGHSGGAPGAYFLALGPGLATDLVATALGDPGGIAEALAGMLSTAGEIDALSLRARAFAAEHTFEKEFARRTDSLNQLLLSLDRNSAPQPSA